MILAYLRMKFSSLKINSDRLASKPGSFSAAKSPWATAAATLGSLAALTVLRWTPPPLPTGSALWKTRPPSTLDLSAVASISEFIAYERLVVDNSEKHSTRWRTQQAALLTAIVVHKQQYIRNYRSSDSHARHPVSRQTRRSVEVTKRTQLRRSIAAVIHTAESRHGQVTLRS